jgi:hypothetical protein
MRKASPAAVAIGGFLAFIGLTLASAWLNIQAVRWGYANQRLRARWDDLRKSEQGLDRRLHQTLSLERLDAGARERFRLKVPSPGQVVLVPEGAGATG